MRYIDVVMAMLTFDTYQFIARLVNAGVGKEHAVAIAEGLQSIDLHHVATKEDLVPIKEDILLLRADILRVKNEILQWLIPMFLGQTALIVTLVKLL